MDHFQTVYECQQSAVNKSDKPHPGTHPAFLRSCWPAVHTGFLSLLPTQLEPHISEMLGTGTVSDFGFSFKILEYLRIFNLFGILVCIMGMGSMSKHKIHNPLMSHLHLIHTV